MILPIVWFYELIFAIEIPSQMTLVGVKLMYELATTHDCYVLLYGVIYSKCLI